jgi:O-antigen/teichoic acid export membrane protein
MRPARGVKVNLAANLVTKTFSGLVSLIMAPIYIRLLGVESYGLIGIYVSLIALMNILDLGLTATINREMARLSMQEGAEQEARDLIRTLASTYWGIGVCVGLGITLGAPIIAHSWVHAQGFSPQTVQRAIMLMGVLFAFQWPDSFYAGGLLGLQRQLTLNAIRIGITALQAGGAILILKFFSDTIIAYLAWQTAVCAGQTLLLAACLWRALPVTGVRARFQRALWLKNRRFTAGLTAISLTATILTQLDRVILSHQLPLKQFAYYVLAANLAANLLYPISPLVDATFPRLVQLTAANQPQALSAFYHKSCQVLSLIILPIWAVAAFFAHPLISLYLHDPATVENVYRPFALLVTSVAFNALVVLPYQLQLAHGHTKLVFRFNLLVIIIVVPIIVWAARVYGPIGAAYVQIGIQAVYMIFLLPLMHQRVLSGELARWYMVDIGRPLLISILISYVARSLMPTAAPRGVVVCFVLLTTVVALITSILACPLLHHRRPLQEPITG